MACNKITAAITRKFLGKRPIKALLDAYTLPAHQACPVQHLTRRPLETSSKSCHVNWVVLDSDWEAEFCRVAESHPKVRAYVKNHTSVSKSRIATAPRRAVSARLHRAGG